MIIRGYSDFWEDIEAAKAKLEAEIKAEAAAKAAAAAGKQTASFWTTAAWFVAGGLVLYYVLKR